MILHAVYCDFLPEVSDADKTSIFEKLQAFSATLEGAMSMEFGPNRDFERKSPGFSDGFVMRFNNQATVKQYADHEIHRALGAELCKMCRNGADGIMVFDLEVAEIAAIA